MVSLWMSPKEIGVIEKEYEYEWSICINDDSFEFDSLEILEKVESRLQEKYWNRDCKIQATGRKDMLSCLWDSYYSIYCK